MRIFEPFSLAAMTTNRCTAACRHCCVDAHPRRRGALSVTVFERVVEELVAASGLRVVVFTGGEPWLWGEALPRAIARCKALGVEVTRVVTNAFWADTPARARRELGRLRAAGLDEVNLSVDDFHQDFVPFDHVRRAFEAAMALDFLGVALANAAGPASAIGPARLLEAFRDPGQPVTHESFGGEHFFSQRVGRTLVMVNSSPLKRLGRPATELRAEELPPPEPEGTGLAAGGCPHALRSVALTPGGHYVACCGLELEGNPVLDYGDLSRPELSVAAVLDKADNDLISNMIAVHGPFAIRDALLQRCPDEVRFSADAGNICEVCRELVFRPENRRALYRRQGAWIELVLEARRFLAETYGEGGRVALPPNVALRATTR